jgi:hypothetical protein
MQMDEGRWKPRPGDDFPSAAIQRPSGLVAHGIADCCVAAGIIVTWPLATYLGGRLPDIPDPASYV